MARRNKNPFWALDDPAFVQDIDAYRVLERKAHRAAGSNADNAKRDAKDALRDLRKRWHWPRDLPLPITPAQEAQAASGRTARPAPRPVVFRRCWPAVRDALKQAHPRWTDAFLDRVTDRIMRAAADVRLAQRNAEADQGVVVNAREGLERLDARWGRRQGRTATTDTADVAHAREALRSGLRKELIALREAPAAPRRGRRAWLLPEAQRQAKDLARRLEAYPYKLTVPTITSILRAAGIVQGPYSKRTSEHRSPAEHAVRRLLRSR